MQTVDLLALTGILQGRGPAPDVDAMDDELASLFVALAVGDDWQKCGVGRKLMTALIDCARQKGYRAVVGDVLSSNSKMFRLMTSLGFSIHPHPDDTAVKRVVKPLTG